MEFPARSGRWGGAHGARRLNIKPFGAGAGVRYNVFLFLHVGVF
jgi:hypothetical protein